MIPRTSTMAFAATLACAPLAWGGTITGSVKIKGAAQPAVVYVEAAPGAVAAPSAHARIARRALRKVYRRTMPVHRG